MTSQLWVFSEVYIHFPREMYQYLNSSVDALSEYWVLSSGAGRGSMVQTPVTEV